MPKRRIALYAAYDPPMDPDPNFDPKNYKRCIGASCGQRLHLLRDFAAPKVKLCFTCRGLRLNPDGTVTPLKPIYPEPERTPRKNASTLPLDDHDGFKRYLRDKARERRAKARADAGLPPRVPPPHGLRCRGICKRFLPRSAFPNNGHICQDCLDAELARIKANSGSD